MRALDQLADEQLAFVPREGLWSLGKVARHIAGAEEGWFRFVVSGELDAWPKFRDENYATIPAVKSLLTEVHDRTKAYLAAVDLACPFAHSVVQYACLATTSRDFSARKRA